MTGKKRGNMSYLVLIVLAVAFLIFYSVYLFLPKGEVLLQPATITLNACGALNTNGGQYILQNHTIANDTCFIISADNVVLDGNGFSINGTNSSLTHGVFAGLAKNITVKNLKIFNFSNGIYFDYVNNSFVKDNLVRFNNIGINVSRSIEVLFSQNNIVSNQEGFYFFIVYNSTLFRNTIYSNNRSGAYFVITLLLNITNNAFEQNRLGIVFNSSTNGKIVGGNISNSREDALVFDYSAGYNSNLNEFVNLTILNTNSSFSDLKYVQPVNDNKFVDTLLRKYNLGSGGLITFKKTGIGEIKFLQAIGGSGNNLSNDAWITYNSFSIDSINNAQINKPANMTFEGLPTNFSNPEIKRNGNTCQAGVCYNFTSLNAGTVVINVSGFGVYCVGNVGSNCPGQGLPPNNTNSTNVSLADLRVTYIGGRYTYINTTTNSSGASFSNFNVFINATVKNYGNANATNSTTRFSVSPTGGNADVNTPPLNISREVVVVASYTLRSGTYIVLVSADNESEINESNESNNNRTFTFFLPTGAVNGTLGPPPILPPPNNTNNTNGTLPPPLNISQNLTSSNNTGNGTGPGLFGQIEKEEWAYYLILGVLVLATVILSIVLIKLIRRKSSSNVLGVQVIGRGRF